MQRQDDPARDARDDDRAEHRLPGVELSAARDQAEGERGAGARNPMLQRQNAAAYEHGVRDAGLHLQVARVIVDRVGGVAIVVAGQGPIVHRRRQRGCRLDHLAELVGRRGPVSRVEGRDAGFELRDDRGAVRQDGSRQQLPDTVSDLPGISRRGRQRQISAVLVHRQVALL